MFVTCNLTWNLIIQLYFIGLLFFYVRVLGREGIITTQTPKAFLLNSWRYWPHIFRYICVSVRTLKKATLGLGEARVYSFYSLYWNIHTHTHTHLFSYQMNFQP